jgi:hypothetical protein
MLKNPIDMHSDLAANLYAAATNATQNAIDSPSYLIAKTFDGGSNAT